MRSLGRARSFRCVSLARPASAISRRRWLTPARSIPDHLIHALGVDLVPSAVNRILWRGQGYPLRFGRVTLQLTDGFALWTWQTIVSFSAAPISYPLLGHTGCLEYMDAHLLGVAPELLLETNTRFPGICE